MKFNALDQTHKKLSQNPDLSDHNKEVLDEFFRKARSQGVGDPTLRDYASRFNVLAPHINFPLDDPEKKDLEDIIAKLNGDEIRKQNGEKYSDYSKDKTWCTISRFYRGFIKKEGKGFNPDINGEELVEDLKVKVDLSVNIDPDTKPDPEQVKKMAQAADNIRDKALIVFGWATGARIGELVVTQHDDEPLTWEDLKFDEDALWVTLDGKTGEREIPVRTGQALMRTLWEQSEATLEDSVFMKKRSTSSCPKCETAVECTNKADFYHRKYKCQNCGWKGDSQSVDRKVEPLTDDAVRRILERTTEGAELNPRIDNNPHDFFRKARAIFKASTGWTEYQLRKFFGWSKNSDAPKHYIELVKEDLYRALKEEYGEEINEEEQMSEDALKPVKCAKCEEINSKLWDYCRNCNQVLNNQELADHNRDDKVEEEEIKKEAYQHGLEYVVKNKDADKKEVFEEVNDFMQELMEQ
ncbi:MAG: tyrosine-type recombinase/integrase [Candidatus Nanohaloarchaea archaeon]